VTFFIVACGFMVAVALAFIAWPLLKSKPVADTPPQKGYVAIIVLAIAIPASAALLYTKVGRLHWQQEIADAATNQTVAAPDVLAMIAKLEQRLRDTPSDIDGWIMLGRSYAALDKPTQALAAYQKAYDLSSGNNIDAVIGLGEAMIVADERSIAGKAGELFELALAKEPNNPKALWYGAIGALTRGNLPIAHQRFQHMLTLNPPQEVRTIIERQLQDLEQQLSAAGQPVSSPAAGETAKPAPEKAQQAGRSIVVHVSLAPEFIKGLDKKTPLFVLARDPNTPGPPLAAVRRAVGDLPFTITITDNDAMMAGRGISSVPRVQVVARISKTGTPQAQAGDLFGDAAVDFAAKPAAEIKIVIDHAVAAASGK
jgi:cytochrome c-type biogenesis protein CcmH